MISFFAIFMTQFTASILINAACLYVNLVSVTNETFVTDYIGLAVWLLGFVFEVVGDY